MVLTTVRKLALAVLMLVVCLGIFAIASFSQVQTEKIDKSGKTSSCMTCHLENLGEESAKLVENYKLGVHYQKGIDCSRCHGGNPRLDDIEAMDERFGFLGKPERKEIPELCASCHASAEKMLSFGSRLRTDQLELYKKSLHGKALFEKGDTKVAVCIDCHGVHGILSPQNPKSSVYKKNIPDTCAKCHANKSLMSQYNIDSTVVEQYKQGYHAELVYSQDELAAPVCSDCHGSHSATPPGIETLEDVCSYCHSITVDYFEQSKHAQAYPALGIKDCLNCHNQHKLERPTEDYFSPTAESACAKCHSSGTREAGIIAQINESIRKIVSMKSDAEKLIEETEAATHLSMLEMKPKLEEIRTHLLSARAKQHTTNPDLVKEETEQAEKVFEEIKSFSLRLVGRAKKVRIIVLVLAGLLAAYGIFLLIYRKVVLDKVYPWQEYGGE